MDHITITKMAKLAKYSRSRFDQLVRQGFFPEPNRDGTSPYYDLDGQETCLKCRDAMLGINGKSLICYDTKLLKGK